MKKVKNVGYNKGLCPVEESRTKAKLGCGTTLPMVACFDRLLKVETCPVVSLLYYGVSRRGMPKKDVIKIRGARIHNLKNIDLDIPKNKLVVICGLSGSGKSSLAFDTIYIEGQRRYLESLSSYARQFLGGIKKSDVEKIENLSPTLAIDQRTISVNPRSTVGTTTEIYDYLRLLFARIGRPFCPLCNILVASTPPQKIVERIFELKQGKSVILGPAIYQKKGSHQATIKEIIASGFNKLRIDNIYYSKNEAASLNLVPTKKHTVEVVVGEIEIFDLRKPQGSLKEKEAAKTKEKKIKRLKKQQRHEALDFVKKALQIGKGIMVCQVFEERKKPKEVMYSSLLSCAKCGFSFGKIEPRLFSFNSPMGACPECQGLGTRTLIDPELILNYNLSLNQGAILPWHKLSRFSRRAAGIYKQQYALDSLIDYNLWDIPLKDLNKKDLDFILYGGQDFEGIIPQIERTYFETSSNYIRNELAKYMVKKTCPECQGGRLKKEALSVKINNKNIFQASELAISDSLEFFQKLKLKGERKKIGAPIIKELWRRLKFLKNVGLGYITTGRETNSLSVGENQRIRLACQLGSGLSGVTYVLDEPTIGLHQKDIQQLIDSLKELRDLNNTVIVVEHDKRVLKQADWIIEIGPNGGERGGRIVFEGTYNQLKKKNTWTGKYVSGKKKVETGFKPRPPGKEKIKLEGASQHNLKNVNLAIPLGNFICVCGVSGAGKSTLIIDILAQALRRQIHHSRTVPGKHKGLKIPQQIKRVVIVDQTPIGKTPRSNISTYTKILDYIREIFSRTREARIRGWNTSYFSFNTSQGKCQACQGQGSKKVEMYFLPDIYVDCEICQGRRYAPEILEVIYQDKNIADVLDMSVERAHSFFRALAPVKERLEILRQIGLGYVRLGQPSPTLSGGEAQRIKIARDLYSADVKGTVYILDEPTVGLHFEDIRKLLVSLRQLQQKGATLIVIEHNPEVIKEADWLIELGPEGGEAGGRIIFEGPPVKLKKAKTPTAQYLSY